MNGQTLNKLTQFSTATFALWPFDINGDTTLLHSKVIIMGLNPSAGIEFGKNFHAKRFDLWYEEAFSKEPFKGCYMTDLISYPEADSNIVIAKWKDEEFRKIHIQNLRQQFELLNVTTQTPILCIGKITKELFKVAFPEYTNIFYINHPNSYRMTGKRQKFLEDVVRIGKEIN